MLLRFEVENHASFRDQQELSLIADKRRIDRAELNVPGRTEHVVTVAAIYGHNASGKSNLVHAISWMRSAVLYSFSKWTPTKNPRHLVGEYKPIPRLPFAFRDNFEDFPSSYNIDFLLNENRYQYGFSCNNQKILEEWLYDYPKGKLRRLFERDSSREVKFGRGLTGPRKASADMLRDNSLYLSVGAAQANPTLSAVYDWFKQDLLIATDEDYPMRLDFTLTQYLENPGPDRIAALELLRLADLGLEDIEFEDKDPDSPFEKDLAQIQEAMEKIAEGRIVVRDSIAHRVSTTHSVSGNHYSLRLQDESSGSNTWISMLGPILMALEYGSILCVDELDARLHPELVDFLVNLFQSKVTNKNGAQLIFNSHATYLLGSSARTVLFRDQIWFTEKNHTNGSSSLFPLTDFKERDTRAEGGPNYERRYFAGRFGAIPYIDDLALTRFSDLIPRSEFEPQKQEAGATAQTGKKDRA